MVCTCRGRCLPCWPALMAPLYPASTLRLLELYFSCLVGSLVLSRIGFLCLFARKNRSAQQYNIAADKIMWGGFECVFCIGVEISKRKKKLIWVVFSDPHLQEAALAEGTLQQGQVLFLPLLSAAFDSHTN